MKGSDPPLCFSHSEGVKAVVSNLNRGESPGRPPKAKFGISAEVLAKRVAEIMEQVTIRDGNDNLPRWARRVAGDRAKAELELDWLAAQSEQRDLTTREERRREYQEKRVDVLGERLGMSADSQLRFEPVRKQNEIAKLRRVYPSRDRTHQLGAMYRILHTPGQLPGELGRRIYAVILQAESEGIRGFLDEPDDAEPDAPDPPNLRALNQNADDAA